MLPIEQFQHRNLQVKTAN